MNTKKKLLILTGIVFMFVVILLAVNYSSINQNGTIAREEYEKFINTHPYSNRNGITREDLKAIPKADRPDLAYEQDFLRTLDPALGRVPRERLLPIYAKVDKFKHLKSGIPGDASNSWVERGPNNIGGRVRALMFDPNDASNKKVWAGSVSGGLWYNNDITDANSVWQAVDDFWSNIAISSIAYDPSNTQIFYVGTGEGWFNADAVQGAGIWKTTDGGLTWTHLTSTNIGTFTTTQKVQVASNGRVIAGTNSGIYVSDDGGTTWINKETTFTSDIEIAADGVIYAGKGKSNVAGKVLKSTDNGDTWLDITPSNVTTERVELACAPSNSLVVYAIASKDNDISWFKKSINGGTSWTSVKIPKYVEQTCVESTTSDFTRSQAWYDLIVAVHPTDQNMVLVGGIDLSKSTDGGANWSTISYWTGACYSYVHADQHGIVFRPGAPNEVVVGNDGGVSYSANAGTVGTPIFSDRNNGLNITQYYACAIHPDPNKNYFLAGAQDNGSHKFELSGVNSVEEITGGDGAYCFIDQKNPEIQISSYVNNSYYISRNAGLTFGTLQSATDGSFINPTDYDDNLHILYSAKSSSAINRIVNVHTVPVISSFTISGLGSKASNIKVSPYTLGSSTIFVGTEGGRIFKVTGAETTTPTATQITGSSLPIGNISCIELGANENEILVTYSNYGLSSIWYTSDGGTNWVAKEGDLPDMPVRWALFNPNNRNQVILATEVGVWSTSNLNDASPVWTPSASGLANVRVDMLQIRESDFEVIAATHGRGVFTSNAFSNVDKNLLAAYFSTKGSTTLKFPGSVQFEDLSTGSPTSYAWTFEGGSPASSTNQHPNVSYDVAGTYTVTLSVSNGIDTKELVKTGYITVGGTNQWKEQATGFTDASRGIDYIDLVDQNVVWATDFDGSNSDNKIKEFTKTIDGGSNWTPGIIDIPGEIYPAMICALDANTAWVPMYPNVANAGGGIYITTDGGLNWTKQETAPFTGADAFANVVHFWDKDQGFCMGDPNGGEFEIYTTTNGGVNWNRVTAANIPNPTSTEYGTVGQFCIADDGVAFFNTTKGRIFKSKDKGATWTVITTPLTGRTKIAFADENHGVLIESSDNASTFKVYYTADGGTTWTSTSNANVYPTYIKYVPGSSRMFISSGANTSKAGASYSIDGGKTWTVFQDLVATQCLALDFYDMSLGWVGQFNSSSTQGGILKYNGITTFADFSISPVVPIFTDPVVFTDNSLSIDGAKTYHWDFGANATPQTADTEGPHSVTYSVKEKKTISLTVNGNTVTKEFSFSVVGIDKIEKELVFSIYPNPASSTISFDLDQKYKNFKVQIFSLSGQNIYSQERNNAGNNSVNIEFLRDGAYFINLTYGDKKVSETLIIRR